MRHLQRILSAARVGQYQVELLKAGSSLAPQDVGTEAAESRNYELVRMDAKRSRRECRLRPLFRKTCYSVLFGYGAGWGLA